MRRLIFQHFSPLDQLLGDLLSVGELLQWSEIHPGTDTENWAWCGDGLACFCNGMRCEVRYR